MLPVQKVGAVGQAVRAIAELARDVDPGEGLGQLDDVDRRWRLLEGGLVLGRQVWHRVLRQRRVALHWGAASATGGLR